MINIISDRVGHYEGMYPQSLATANATGDYYAYTKHNTWVCNIGSTTLAATVKLDILQATDADGTDVKAITDQDGSSTATATYTAGARSTELSMLMDTITNGKTIILQTPFDPEAITYTKAAAYSLADKEFLTNADFILLVAAHQPSLVSAVIDGTHNSIKLAKPERGGYITETGTNEVAALVTTPVSGQLRISVASDAFDAANGFLYAAPKVTTVGTAICSVTLEREENRMPNQGNCAYDVRIK